MRVKPALRAAEAEAAAARARAPPSTTIRPAGSECDVVDTGDRQDDADHDDAEETPDQQHRDRFVRSK